MTHLPLIPLPNLLLVSAVGKAITFAKNSYWWRALPVRQVIGKSSPAPSKINSIKITTNTQEKVLA